MKLNSNQLKIKSSMYVLYKPHNNHRAKAYNRFIKDKEKWIKVYHYGKSPNYKERYQERKKETKEIQTSQKAIRGDVKTLLINNYLK